MKKIVSLIIMCCTFTFFACGGDDYLSVEVVDDVQIPGDGDTGGTIHGLFNNPPGTLVPLASFTGAVDPVGTKLAEDFDGDAIDNVDETTSNVWVADYPVIETNIATPVTMKIEVLETSDCKSTSFSSEITNNDVTSSSDFSTEAVHRTELNLKTVQFQDSFNTEKGYSHSTETSRGGGGGVSIGGFGVNANRSRSSSASNSYNNKYGETRTKWQDVPFKNNTNRKGWSMNRSDASRLSRTVRGEMRRECTSGYEIKANAGYVRAALYIDNISVNMPVRVRNILCSFMLETPEGQLLPVQSFRVRNEDYSIFEIELYGGSTFGPYVIELNGLNTAEIKEAINSGYNPKIFIVDYEMTHVDDSNYRKALNSNFIWDNLKIIEENAKGRTAGIKFVGPNVREFYRVVAFDTDGAEDRTGSSGATFVMPGVSLEKALRRIGYAGKEGGMSKEIEFANYLLDFTGFNPEMDIVGPDGSHYGPRFIVKGIKSVNGIESKLPTREIIPETGDEPEIHVMKPLVEWTQEDFDNFKLWVVYSKGKYYLHSGDMLLDANTLQTYPYQGDVPIVQGVRSTIWPGDHYDIVYLDLTEYYGLLRQFGSNPLETGAVMEFNTRWNRDDFGEYPYYPNTRSTYLGEVTPGDAIEFTVKLKDTYWLNPNFGDPIHNMVGDIYGSFSYNWHKSTRRFDIHEAVDFEISFGLGGDHDEWVNIWEPVERSPYSKYADKVKVVDYSWNYLEQEFTVKLGIDPDIPGVAENGLVKLYLRPSPNNAYRETIWPLFKDDVKKFRGVLAVKAPVGSTTLSIMYPAGEPVIGGELAIRTAAEAKPYIIAGYSSNAEKTLYEITLAAPLGEDHIRGAQAYMELALGENPTEQDLHLAVENYFFEDWNATYNLLPPTNENGYVELTTANDPTSPMRYTGFDTRYVEANWAGHNNWSNMGYNKWSEGTEFGGFLEKAFYPFLTSKVNRAMYLVSGNRDFEDKDDFLVSTTNTNNQEAPSVAISDGCALVVWHYEPTIRGRWCDAASGSALGNEFLLSTTNTNIQAAPSVAISDGRALVVWSFYPLPPFEVHTRGRWFDTASGSALGNDFVVSTTAVNPSVAISNGRALIVWTNGDIYGRWYDTASGNALGNEFLLSTTNTNIQSAPSVAISDGHALVVWESQDNGTNTHDIRGRWYDAASGNALGNDFLLSTTNTNIQSAPSVAISDGHALVVWESNETGLFNTIRGRWYDAASGSALGNDFVLYSKANAQLNPSVAISDGRAFVVWGSVDTLFDIRGRWYDATSGSALGNDFVVSTTNTNNQENPSVAISGRRALIVWKSKDNGSDNDIRGRWIEYKYPSDGKLLSHGLNYFMVSPLVERNYEVKVKLAE